MDFVKKFAGGENAEATSYPVATEADEQSTKTDASGHGGGLMDKVTSALGGHEKKAEEPEKSEGGLMDKLNSALGGGTKGEKKEDGLDKTVDWVQEHVLGGGPQTNENVIEQTKDEAISDTIRNQYKKMTGHDLPIADK